MQIVQADFECGIDAIGMPLICQLVIESFFFSVSPFDRASAMSWRLASRHIQRVLVSMRGFIEMQAAVFANRSHQTHWHVQTGSTGYRLQNRAAGSVPDTIGLTSRSDNARLAESGSAGSVLLPSMPTVRSP